MKIALITIITAGRVAIVGKPFFIHPKSHQHFFPSPCKGLENFRLDTKNKHICPLSNMPQTVQRLKSFCKLQLCSLLLFFILKSSTLVQCSFLLNTKFTVFAANEGSLGSNLFCANNPQKPCTMHIQLK